MSDSMDDLMVEFHAMLDEYVQYLRDKNYILVDVRHESGLELTKLNGKWALYCDGEMLTNLPIKERIALATHLPAIEQLLLDEQQTLKDELNELLHVHERHASNPDSPGARP